MRYILGIDQGGSKTHAIVVEETGRIVGVGKARGACHSTTGIESAIDAIYEASIEALTQANITFSAVDIIFAGMTGVDWDFEAPMLEQEIRKAFHIGDVVVVNDAIIAMRSGTDSPKCAVICAGSGLNCAIKNKDDTFVYGFYIPDDLQGGSALGKKAVQAVFDSHMGLLPETTLTREILAFFDDDSVDALLYRRTTGIRTKDYLRLPIILENEALKGDRVSLQIWQEYGETIAQYIVARMRIMGMIHDTVEVVLSGSILKSKVKVFQDAIKAEITRSAKKAIIKEAEYEPIVGAALLGLEHMYNGPLPSAVVYQIQNTAQNFPLKRM